MNILVSVPLKIDFEFLDKSYSFAMKWEYLPYEGYNTLLPSLLSNTTYKKINWPVWEYSRTKSDPSFPGRVKALCRSNSSWFKDLQFSVIFTQSQWIIPDCPLPSLLFIPSQQQSERMCSDNSFLPFQRNIALALHAPYLFHPNCIRLTRSKISNCLSWHCLRGNGLNCVYENKGGKKKPKTMMIY